MSEVVPQMDVGGEIRLGSYLFTMIEPHPGHEVAYNRWYERDHFYAGCMIGPWLFSGARFVATRDLKDLRIGEEPDLFGEHDGSTLSIYWVIDGKMSEHFDWGSRQVRWLHDNDRMFPHREHVHTNLYSHRSTVERDEDGTPVELALEHRYQTLVCAWIERHEKELEAVASKVDPSSEEVIGALIRPLVELLVSDRDRGHRYLTLMHRLQLGHHTEQVFLTRWPEFAKTTQSLLEQVLPDVAEPTLALRFDLSWETMLGSLARASDLSPSELNHHVSELIDYLSGALAAPQTSKRPSRAGKQSARTGPTSSK